jgi:phosphatidylethanolamine-binding protein (PEBP) family uncharacterized protein
MTFTRTWSSALVVVALSCAACSSSSKSSSTATPTSAPTTAPGATTTAPAATHKLTLTSSAFENNGTIPTEYTCSGAAKTVPLQYSGDVLGATSYALIVHDPDAPVPGGFTHWVVTGLPPTAGSVPPVPRGAAQPRPWVAPCPPKGSAPHHYRFTLYAVHGPVTTQSAVAKAAIAQVTLVGTYGR